MHPNQYTNQRFMDSIFWVEVEKIKPNPYQPRTEFNESALFDLAESIRQYGILQPLVVTRKEMEREDGGLFVEYELISGERRLRASKIAGVLQVPVVIRTGQDSDREKLELAIIENLQREDLNPIDKARAFKRLVSEFEFTHTEIAKKIGKSRELVSNTIRLLALPEDIIEALSAGKISEGHARPILMLSDKPDEQSTLFKDILYKRLTVRESESVARRIAQDKVRKKKYQYDPELDEIEQKISLFFGLPTHIHHYEGGRRMVVDFSDMNELEILLSAIEQAAGQISVNQESEQNAQENEAKTPLSDEPPIDDRAPEEKIIQDNTDADLYSVKNFSL